MASSFRAADAVAARSENLEFADRFASKAAARRGLLLRSFSNCGLGMSRQQSEDHELSFMIAVEDEDENVGRCAAGRDGSGVIPREAVWPWDGCISRSTPGIIALWGSFQALALRLWLRAR